jgi:hypothetical protein
MAAVGSSRAKDGKTQATKGGGTKVAISNRASTLRETNVRMPRIVFASGGNRRDIVYSCYVFGLALGELRTRKTAHAPRIKILILGSSVKSVKTDDFAKRNYCVFTLSADER